MESKADNFRVTIWFKFCSGEVLEKSFKILIIIEGILKIIVALG
jgi:hypothetical protein